MKKLSWLILITVLCGPGANAEQSSPKSPGLSPVPKIESFEQVEQILLEHARAIDFTHRSMRNDLVSIDKDEIPALEASIAALGGGDITEYRIPLLSGITWGQEGGTSYLTWTGGTIRYDGEDYELESGNSASSAANQWVYWDLDDGGTTLGMTLAPSVNKDRWFLLYFDGTNMYPALQSTIVHAGLLQAGTITADQIKANTITSGNILNGTVVAGDFATNTLTRIFSSEADKTDIYGWGDTDLTYIAPGKILLHAADYGQTLDDWETYSGGTSYIDGGNIYTDSILAASLNITDIADIATLIAGDITVGNATNSGTLSLWSANGYGDAVIRSRSGAGYTDFGLTNAGFIMGFDDTDDKYKFEIGDADDYLKWDGTDITIRGTINATDITTGSLTVGGGTITAGAGGSVAFPSDFSIGEYDGGGEGMVVTTHDVAGTDYGDIRVKAIDNEVGVDPHYIMTFGSTYGGLWAKTFPGLLGYRDLTTGSFPSEITLNNTLAISPELVKCKRGYFGEDGSSNLTLVIEDNAAGFIGQGSTQITMSSTGAMAVPMEALAASVARIKIGTYDGDGNATKAISGIGIAPDGVIVIPMENNDRNVSCRVEGMVGTNAKNFATSQVQADCIRSLDATGFTVGDGTGNVATANMNASGDEYWYIAWESN